MTTFRGYAPPPGPDMIERLGWTDAWIDMFGQRLTLTSMDDEHLFNTLGYLVRHGRKLWAYAHPGEMLPADVHIIDWLLRRRLWSAIVLELRAHHALKAREDLLATLRARAIAYRQAAVGAYSTDLDEQERLFDARR